MASADEIKDEIDQAMRSHNARVAILIEGALGNALDLIDEQPAAVLEAMVGRGRDLQMSGSAPRHRYEVRAAVIKYLEERRSEAHAREHDLACAVTGGDLPGE